VTDGRCTRAAVDRDVVARSVGNNVGVVTSTGSKAGGFDRLSSINVSCCSNRRQTDSRLALTPCRWATSGTEAPLDHRSLLGYGILASRTAAATQFIRQHSLGRSPHLAPTRARRDARLTSRRLDLAPLAKWLRGPQRMFTEAAPRRTDVMRR
jgi:hypothetical protein